ncbi:alpha-1,3-galactosidase-related protein [Pedobacter sp.]|uniref:alpha-1,3-galactosidase-related protein n=1 Tax=Pedobacter sp. TaxID=1411316 RepID=UPI002BBAC327|nr:hypothetical protein [Pedobacter sp.]HWW38030.1 hypothetical protein [Pedobacter sp.]
MSIFTSSLTAQTKVKLYKLSAFGIFPNNGKNTTPLLAAVLKKIRNETAKDETVKIQLQKGRYDFYPEGAGIREYFISNHDQDNPKTVGIELENFKNVILDGRGADLIFHGRMLPIALLGCSNLILKDLQVDFETPQISQVKILENDTLAGSIVFQTAPWVKYTVKDSVFYNKGEGWEMSPVSGIAFEEGTKRIVFNSGDIRVGTKGVSEISPGILKAHHWNNKRLVPGTVIAMRTWDRPAPGIFVHKCKDISLKDITVHYAEGMGLLAQLTENIYMDGFSVRLRGKADPRYFTTQADATHFSGCKGKIVSTNGLYEGMMDDAINIHGTYLKLIKRLDDRTIIGRYMHSQSYGFDWGNIGDTVQFVRSKTMEQFRDRNIIKSISVVQGRGEPIKEFRIEFKEPLDKQLDPAMLDVGIENLSWTPSVVFTHNIVRNNRARGALFSTPKPTLVAYNLFDHTSGSAILLCGDSNGWFESGSCHDLTIRNNRFVNALTSMYQFTNAVISIYPEIPDLKSQKQYFHSGIRIEHNKFEMFDQPILYARSVNGLTFKNNEIRKNKQYPAFHRNKKPILLDKVDNAVVKDNRSDGLINDLLKN